MTSEDPVFGYMTGQLRDSHVALIAAFEAESAAAVSAFAPDLDIAYAAHPRARFDFFRAPGQTCGTVIYFHAGYWQSRDKSGFRFLAPGLMAQGWNLVLVNYPLCPDVDLATLVETARLSVPAVMRHAGPGPVVLAGHSAGAHLVVELLLGARDGWGDPVLGGWALSGVYDLVPLIGTPLNERLRLDVATARALSPVHRVRPGQPPVLFAVGGAETATFRAQNAAMHAAWIAAGNTGALVEVPGLDHFSLLRAMPFEVPTETM